MKAMGALFAELIATATKIVLEISSATKGLRQIRVKFLAALSKNSSLTTEKIIVLTWPQR